MQPQKASMGQGEDLALFAAGEEGFERSPRGGQRDPWLRKAGIPLPCLFAEFTGSFLLLFFGGLVASNSADSGLSTAALGTGMALAVLTYGTAGASGGHLNPAVTAALFTIGEGNTAKAVWYCSVQLGGAVCGAGFLLLFCPDTAVLRNPFVIQGVLYDGAYRNLAAVGVFEFVCTFTLVYTFCAVMLDGRSGARQYGPLALGLVYATCVYCAGPYTGASLNPARTFATAVAFGDYTGMWIAVLSALLGGGAAAAVYKGAYGIRPLEEGGGGGGEYIRI